MDREHTVSVVIPTRNRGASIVDTIESILANGYQSFDVVVVDQSTGSDTAIALQAFENDPRLRYISTASTGASTARNIGLAHSDAEFVLFTDDDCTVPADWVKVMVSTLRDAPRAALVFCSVVAGPHDRNMGTVPNHVYSAERRVGSVRDYFRSIGMSAGLAGRREIISELGGFDRFLGPGSVFRCAEDHDLALRALISGWEVVETPNTQVIHHGFRTFDEFRELTGRDWFGLGAAQSKHVQCGHFEVFALVAYNSFVRGLWMPASLIFELKKPSGFRRFYYFWKGFFHAWRAPINRELGLFEMDGEAIVSAR